MRLLFIILLPLIVALAGCATPSSPTVKTADKGNSEGLLLLDPVFQSGTTFSQVDYIVDQGDTLVAIARKLNTTVEYLKSANPGLADQSLQVGQKIIIYRPQPGIVVNLEIYVIKPGDTFGRIAKMFNTSLVNLEALNPGVDISKLKIGEEIIVSSRARPGPSEPEAVEDIPRG